MMNPLTHTRTLQLASIVLLSNTAAIRVMATETNQPIGPIVTEELIYESAPYPACHASTIVETKDALVAAWFGGTHERHEDVGIWCARKVAGKWSEPVELANGVIAPEKRFPCWNPVLFQPADGPLLLYYKVGPTPRDWWGMLLTSEDNGQTWSDPRRLPDGMLGPIKNKPIELADGTLVLPTSDESDGWRVHFEFADSSGSISHRTKPVNDPEKIRAIQPSLLIHPNGRLQAVGRTRFSGVFDVWSEDSGQTWGEMSLLGLPNPSSGTDAVTLADGRHLLIYNHSSVKGVRSPLNVAVSADGKAWQAAAVIEDNPEAKDGFAYPAVIQTSDGLVHVTYTWKRERIKHVVIDPARLKAVPIVNGQWPTSVVIAK